VEVHLQQRSGRIPAAMPEPERGGDSAPPAFLVILLPIEPAWQPAGVVGGLHSRGEVAGEFLNRLAKVEVVGTHDEADRVAMRPTAEAMEKALVVADCERRRLFGVERAQPDGFATAPGELDPAADQLRQRNATAQVFEI